MRIPYPHVEGWIRDAGLVFVVVSSILVIGIFLIPGR